MKTLSTIVLALAFAVGCSPTSSSVTPGATQEAADEKPVDRSDPKPGDNVSAQRAFKPAKLLRGGESSCEAKDPRPSTCGWLLAFDAVVVGNISAIEAVRSPAASSFGHADHPILYGAPEECPGQVQPAIDITLTDVAWLTGSGPPEVTIRFAFGTIGSWSPPVLFDTEGAPYWFEDNGYRLGDTLGVGLIPFTHEESTIWTSTTIPPFTFDISGNVQAMDAECNLRYPDGFIGTSFEGLMTEAGSCTDPDDLAVGTKWKLQYMAIASNPVDRYAAQCNWDEAPPSCVSAPCPSGMRCTEDEYCEPE